VAPDDGEPHPVVLMRTPYVKEVRAPMAFSDTRLATERGYAVAIVDDRGRGASDGTFEPFADEEADGFDTVAWVAEQEWCDGNVVMAGTSYEVATQWLTAVSAPPALRGIAPVLSSDDYGEGWSYRRGVAELGFLASWSAAELAALPERMLDDPSVAWSDLEAAVRVAPWLKDWLSHGPDSEYWRSRSVAPRRDQLQVPVLVVAGWYDIFLSGSLAAFARSRDRRDRLIVGPWGHDGGFLSHLVGEANTGIAGLGLGRLFGWVLDFYDSLLAGREPELPRVRAYALGAREWIDLDSWPPRDSQPLTSELEPGAFTVDPGSPVPSYGGRGVLVQVPGGGYGVADQRPLLERADVHVAGRITLAADTLLAGPITARLRTAASGEGERLWTATLCQRQADGALFNLADGVASAAPEAEEVAVDLGDTFCLVPAGSELVLLVAGSSFPRWPKPAAAGRQRLLAGSGIELTTAPLGLLEITHPATEEREGRIGEPALSLR
jgi:uncharacterized protein